MGIPRIIPTLLVKNKGLMKGKCFNNHRYIGDPINIIEIFNKKKSDEILILDLEARDQNRIIENSLLEKISKYATMPFSIGGGIKTLKDADKILKNGAEKICICSDVLENEKEIKMVSEKYGAQSIIISLDIKKSLFGYSIYQNNGRKKINENIVDYLKIIQSYGIGEILLNNIDLEGTKKGFNKDMIEKFNDFINIPLIVSGGIKDFLEAKNLIDEYNVSVALGASVVFQGPRDAILIDYPDKNLKDLIFDNFFNKIRK